MAGNKTGARKATLTRKRNAKAATGRRKTTKRTGIVSKRATRSAA